LADFSDDPMLNLPREKSLNQASRPSDELLALFNPKPRTR